MRFSNGARDITHMAQPMPVNLVMISQISVAECHRIVLRVKVPIVEDRFPGLGDDSAHSFNIRTL